MKTKPKEFNTEEEIKVTPVLNSKAYALVEKDGLFEIVKFNFDAFTLTMSELEVVSTNSNQFDAADELILLMDEEIYQ